MELSYELISQFAKQIANKDKKTTKESTVYGTVKVDANGNKYVKLDGSDQLTPLTDDERPSVDATTTNANDGDRVSVLIKNHTATVTGNISSPSARTDDVEKIADDVSDIQEFDIMIGQQVQADKAYFKKLLGDDATLGKLEASEASILELIASSAEIDKLLADKIKVTDLIATKIDADLVVADTAIVDKLKAAGVDVLSLVAEKAVVDKLIADKATLQTLIAEDVAAKYATIGELNAVSAEIDKLDAKYITADQVSAEYATIENLNAASGKIENLETEMFDAETGNIKFANIDFSNIGKAAMEYLYAESGLIDNVVVGDGKITGELVGVTIKGDLIEGNTIKADKLVVKGSDGLYYKLNVGAGATTSEEVTEAELQNGLHGSAIIAKTITADQISVKDLVAFDATIGGFTITDEALYSGVKESVNNTTRGTYLDSEGQVAFGDGDNFVKYYRMADGSYKLDISAASIKFGSSHKNLETAFQEANAAIEQNAEQIALRATKTEVAQTLTGYSTKAETAAAIKIESDKIESSVSKNYQMVGSRGEQLVTNGNGLLGDNTNFSMLTFDGAVANNSPGSFTYPTLSTYITPFTDEFIPVDTSKRYTLSLDAKTKNGLARLFGFLNFYDADKNQVFNYHHSYVTGTTVALTQEIKNGDTVIHLSDVSGWKSEASHTYIMLWNYANSFGYAYPPETYTRNTYNISTANNAPVDGAIDYANNTVTLQSPWTSGTIPAGTYVSQGRTGSTYKYLFNVIPTTEWKTYEGAIDGVDYTGGNKDYMFPPGVAYAKIGFLWNLNSVADQIWATNITLRDTTVDNELATRLTNTETKITQTNEKISLCATKTELNNYTSKTEVENIGVGGVNLLSNSDVEMTGSNEFIRYADLAPIFDKYGLITYTISFDIKSADVSQKNTILVYCLGTDGTKHTFTGTYVPVTTEYVRHSVTVTPHLDDASATTSHLAFFGTYNTGNIPSVKNVKVERGSKATDWTPAPEDVEGDISEAQSTANNAVNRVTTAEARIDLVSDAINAMVSGENGESILTQTEDGWVFSMKDITDAVDDLKSNVASLQTDNEQAKADVDALKQTLDDHGSTLEYVHIITDKNDNPCIELGESDSDFKHLITNKASQIMDGENVVTEMDVDGVKTENVTVRNEIRQGQWAWVVHGNGNLGLMWKEPINSGGDNSDGGEDNTCPNCGATLDGDGYCPNYCYDMENTFYVNGTPYTYYVGMTWEEYINSGYNKMVSCEGCGSEHKQFSQSDDQVYYFTGDCSGIGDVPIYLEYPDDPPHNITPSDYIESECEYRW